LTGNDRPWLSLPEVLRVTEGRMAASVDADRVPAFRGCSIDTRTLQGGDLFVPLPGSRVDGHEFVTAALQGPAGGSLVAESRVPEDAWARAGKPVIVVRDPLRALQTLGRHCRARAGIPVVAVTGSNGKTTTKEMIAAVLGARYRVHKNEGNRNNHIGVPLTLTRLTPEHQMLVLEMGMSARGEIRELALLARPDVGVLTNAGAAHLESLGTVDEVARAKSELAESLPRDGLLILNADDERLWNLNKSRPVAKKSYALENPEADLKPVRMSLTAQGGAFFALADGTEVRLRLLGRHNVRNALAAILVGDRFQVSRAEAKAALEALQPERHRLELLDANGIYVLDDAYNANPSSMREALLLLASIETGGERRAVLGDMLELGPEAERFHEEVGRQVPRDARLYVAGSFAPAVERGATAAGVPANRIRRFSSVPDMAAAVAAEAGRGDLILVKASRGMRLEQVVERLVPGREDAAHPMPAGGRN
jgi:UDP-N-acetylmuramoyl-tripeptide--D-alanyl-D-alanine ligase